MRQFIFTLCLCFVVLSSFAQKTNPADPPKKNNKSGVKKDSLVKKTPPFLFKNTADSLAFIEHAYLGIPSQALPDTAQRKDFLLIKKQYVLSYNQANNCANWVSWHLSQEWVGEAERSDKFVPDTTLPRKWYKATPNDYRNTGFDRGHICPSADRTSSEEDNNATFLMTNIFPQAPNNNQRTWKYLEDYARRLVDEGNELYITAGVYGKGGVDKLAKLDTLIGTKSKIVVPEKVWKVIVVLPDKDTGIDFERIDENTRVIAVLMPNTQDLLTDWTQYRTTVDDIEALTGYDFFKALPPAIEEALEKKIDAVVLKK
ncbi:MAG TPA: DNA/RNA non-specific endonuclease [Microscillaceae bacterium]|nr:DNA/RNA non-specific endonuclease [Microscillaceae bacterium]